MVLYHVPTDCCLPQQLSKSHQQQGQQTVDTCHIWFAGTNRQEDVDIYAFDPPTPADVGTLNNVVVNSTDEVLKALLRADINLSPRCIAGWENHRENLPEDPSQVSHP